MINMPLSGVFFSRELNALSGLTCFSGTAHATCDNDMTVWVDGEHVDLPLSHWTKEAVFQIYRTTDFSLFGVMIKGR